MTFSELAQHLTREELAAFGLWPEPFELFDPSPEDGYVELEA